MKFKKVLIALLSLSALLLFGCKSQELSEATSRDYQTYDGELRSLGGIRVNKIITNVFQTDEGDVYYAYSERYDLSDEEYSGKRIEAYGLVTAHEELDKKLFEIRRISEAPALKLEEAAAEDADYSNEGIGFKLTYANDWKVEEESKSVMFSAPIVKTESPATGTVAEGTDGSDVGASQDYVYVSVTTATLSKTSADPLDDRADDIRNYVRANYPMLVGVGSEQSYLGVDKLFAVKYKTPNGDQYYFVPRGSSLFEISYTHSTLGDKVKYTNVFYDMIATFRFIPAESNTGANVREESVENVPAPEEENESAAEIAIPTGYREFESNPFKFKISYPSSWYYSGGGSGYDFSDVPMEDGSEVLIRLDLSAEGTEGNTVSAGVVRISIKVGDRYYVLSGASELKSVLEIMSKSIVEITE